MDSTPEPVDLSRPETPSRVPAPRTPGSRRAVSLEPPSSRRSALQTPLGRNSNRDVNSARRSAGRLNNAPTPHAVAARRALDQRRTALLTPGRARRQSLMEQRETPMNVLQNLGKVLANKTKPIVSSSSPQVATSSIAPRTLDGGEDDDPPIVPPRLSLPLGEDDEDSELVPPRSAGLEDDTTTVPGVELPRRFRNEQRDRLSRASLPSSMQNSDVLDSNDDTEELARQSDFFPGLLEDLRARANADPTLNRVDVDDRRSISGRQSELNLEIPPDVADQTTFVLSPPPLDGRDTSPFQQERSVADASARNAASPSGVGNVTLANEIGNERDDTDIYDRPESETGQVEVGGESMAGDDEEEEEEEEEEEVVVEAGGEAGEAGEDMDLDERNPEQNVEDRLEPKQPQPASRAKSRPRSYLKQRQRRISKHGIEYPALPPAFVRRVAQTALHTSGLSNPRVSTDTLTALTQASEWFFEQLGDDLGAYANHANRKTIEESDMATLMRRQRQITSEATMFSLAQRHLPRELLQELKMPAPAGGRIPRKRGRHDDADESSEMTTSTPTS